MKRVSQPTSERTYLYQEGPPSSNLEIKAIKMKINSINRNKLDKSSSACPIPPSLTSSYHTSYTLSKENWISKNRLLLYYLISIITGALLLYIASFIPPTAIIQEITTETGFIYSIQIYSIIISPIPFLISIGIGLAAVALVPLIEQHSFPLRLGGAILFSLLYSIAFVIDLVKTTVLSSALSSLYGYPPTSLMLPWLTSPWLFFLMATTVIICLSLASMTLILITAYFSELLFTSLRGPISIDLKTRRTAVSIQGGERTTVLSINHKGGYTRAFTRPSKWQSYDRED
jgi:hypothetical protein